MEDAPLNKKEMTPLIRVKNLSVAYKEELILDDISFEVFRGEVFVIMGNSGCGKSTLLRQMIGLEKPNGGEILVENTNIVTASEKELDWYLKKIGVMFQSGALFGSLTLLENTRLPLDEFTDLELNARNMIAYTKLALVGLSAYANYLPAEVSGGMQKRAAIARAMALDPQILFLDEPSAGLDPLTSTELDQLITRLTKSLDITFVIVSHEIASIFSIANRVIMLDKRLKKIVATGSPHELRKHSNNSWVNRFFERLSIDKKHEDHLRD